MTSPNSIVTRFAPSPTGYMHIGSLRTALFAYLYAKKHNGVFILRIEDTDKSREVEGSIEHIRESLRWLGIEWDFGPDTKTPFGSCIQSERLPSYKKYAEKLIERGLAYPDPYTHEDIEKFRQNAQNEKRPFLMRNHRPSTFEAWDGTKPLRLKVPEVKRYTWHDAVRGELSAGEEMLDDIILIKADGYPTYNFAHIVDDYEMNVTHIMRGDEFISSVPKFLSIYDALEISYPVFATLPPILKSDRSKKLGKRDGAKDILEYRDEGYLPEAMLNFLALIGWNPGTPQEIFSKNELTDEFSLEKIQKSGGAFNEDKLLWMNKQYLDRLTDEEFYSYIKESIPEKFINSQLFSSELLERMMPLVRERTHVRSGFLSDLEGGEYDFAFFEPVYETELLTWKKDTSASDSLPRLNKAKVILGDLQSFTISSIKDALMPYAEEVGKGELLWPLRVALSGKERSPDPFTIAYIIGKTQVLKRIDVACDKIRT